MERGWFLLLIATAWWACCSGGMWRLLRGRVSWGRLWSQAERRQENSRCDSESNLADTPQAHSAGILLGMSGHPYPGLSALLLNLPVGRMSGGSVVAPDLRFYLGRPHPCDYRAVVTTQAFVNTYFAVFLC